MLQTYQKWGNYTMLQKQINILLPTLFCHYFCQKHNHVKRTLATGNLLKTDDLRVLVLTKRYVGSSFEMKIQHQKDLRVLVKFLKGLTLETRFNKVHSLQFIHFSNEGKILK